MDATTPADPKTQPAQVAPFLTLTVKEELAVIVQRINTHSERVVKPECRARLEIASDLIRSAIARL